ncbi:MAG: serine/threonine protein kinase [Acidobacteria bacterium]|nr:serine/threonine protein kinase [Acidobacteriota bacterium]
MPFELGKRVGDYQFIDIVNSNRDGTSYKVRNVPEQRYEILRVLSESTQSDPVRLERFQREAKILARLKHPHIVSYRASTQIDGRFVLATELVEGTTLAERLELGPVSLPDGVRHVWQALEALECAHAEGVVHRDVTTAKLFLTTDSELKLGGFSLARSTADPRLTQAGVTIGTAHYMSPEQVQASAELDARSDLYSLGVVFYETVTGRKPFDSESQFDVMLAHVETIPDPPSKWNPMVPLELDTLILKALAKKPEARFQSARDFREALMSISLGAAPEPAEDIEKALEAIKRRGRESTRQAQVLAEEILGHQSDITAHAAGQAKAKPGNPYFGLPKEAAFAIVIVLAIGLFLITSGIR